MAPRQPHDGNSQNDMHAPASDTPMMVDWESLQEQMQRGIHNGGVSNDNNDDSGNIGWGLHIINTINAGRTELTEEEQDKINRELAAAQKARQGITQEKLAASGIQPTPDGLAASAKDLGQPLKKAKTTITTVIELPRDDIDFFATLGNYPELVIELVEHIRPADLVSIYAISKDLHTIISRHMTSTMTACAKTQAPESYYAFHPELYTGICVPDPIGRLAPQGGEVRLVPGLRWLQQIYYREKIVRDILACMARQGHRMPQGASFSLKKMWMLMDIGTNALREQLISSTYFKASDLYNLQMFLIKLDMRFNDPVEGPGFEGLRMLILGQKSLTPLANLLKRRFTPLDVIKMVIRYDYRPIPMFAGDPLWGIAPTDVGLGHLEGWGMGTEHLLRPDQLVIRESVRRDLELDGHLLTMMLWGYVDPITGNDTPPTAEEMYMSDDGESRSDLERMKERAAARNRAPLKQ